jgi:hypothetical protein
MKIGKLTDRERERCIREDRCFRCREKGHISNQCRQFNLNFTNQEISDDEENNKSDEEYLFCPPRQYPSPPARESQPSPVCEISLADSDLESHESEPNPMINQKLLAIAHRPSPEQHEPQLCQLSDYYRQQRRQQHRLLYLTGLLNNTVKARCLIDCGATHNFIAEHLLPPDAKLQHVQKTVRVVNGATVTTKGKVELSLWIRNSTFHITAWVFHTSQFDVVLGQPWLSQYNPVINWKFRTVEYQHKPLTAPSQSLRVDGTTSLSLASIRDIRQAVTHQDGDLFMVKVTTPKPDDTRSEKQVQKWQKEYPEVFSPPSGLPPHCHIQHTIPTGNADPVACRPYRLSQPEQKELERHLQELLEAGYIQPSSSAWAAPILFVRKKSGELRMVIDY